MWNGKMVAVKVLEYSQQQNEDGCLLEGLLSEQVQHPHVVRPGQHSSVCAATCISSSIMCHGLARPCHMAWLPAIKCNMEMLLALVWSGREESAEGRQPLVPHWA
jgi:hypothetical protein